jgi:hypothetical protein
MLEHGINDGEELAHAGDERDLLGLPCSAQADVEVADGGIKSRGNDRSHIERRPHMCSSTQDRATATKRSTIAIERGDADQRRDLFMCQRAEFRQMGQQRCGQDGADTGDAAQQLILLTPHWTLLNGIGQIGIGLLQCPFQPGDMCPQIFPDGSPGAHRRGGRLSAPSFCPA